MSKRIFLIGRTGTGKTTCASYLTERAALHGVRLAHVSAGGWVRKAKRDASREEMTAYACQELSQDPDVAINYMQKQIRWIYGDVDGIIIDGVRNPRDFWMMFRPQNDTIVYFASPECTDVSFEINGIVAILTSVQWWNTNIQKLPTVSVPVEMVYDYATVRNFVFTNIMELLGKTRE